MGEDQGGQRGGGLAVAIAEGAMWSGLGAKLRLPIRHSPAVDLFGESPSRLVVTARPRYLPALELLARIPDVATARHAVATGFAMAIPVGYEVQVRPRSGLALKHGLTCLNTPGTIDADYRGEVKVILINLGEEDFVIRRGDRIAQLVIAPVASAQWAPVDSLDETARGAGGFGSTGAA